MPFKPVSYRYNDLKKSGTGGNWSEFLCGTTIIHARLRLPTICTNLITLDSKFSICFYLQKSSFLNYLLVDSGLIFNDNIILSTT